jgi:N-methylhydantoinase A
VPVDGFEALDPQPVKSRPVCFDPGDGYVDTPVLWRADLAPGAVVSGPAIIEEFGSTVPLHPGFTARVDDYLNIVVTREPTA